MRVLENAKDLPMDPMGRKGYEMKSFFFRNWRKFAHFVLKNKNTVSKLHGALFIIYNYCECVIIVFYCIKINSLISSECIYQGECFVNCIKYLAPLMGMIFALSWELILRHKVNKRNVIVYLIEKNNSPNHVYIHL